MKTIQFLSGSLFVVAVAAILFVPSEARANERENRLEDRQDDQAEYLQLDLRSWDSNETQQTGLLIRRRRAVVVAPVVYAPVRYAPVRYYGVPRVGYYHHPYRYGRAVRVGRGYYRVR